MARACGIMALADKEIETRVRACVYRVAGATGDNRKNRLALSGR